MDLTPDINFVNQFVAHRYMMGNTIINAVAWNYNNYDEIVSLVGYIPLRIIDGELFVYGRRIYQYDIIYTRFPYVIDYFRRLHNYSRFAFLESDIFVIRYPNYTILEPAAIDQPQHYPCK